ncbi:pyridoxal phosphate-dependent aminotransferase [Feifania hominis]|uniref:Pyridoxal phosphate-dependent aminotransferase n=1 Tax=Feifania hominis TaxID=2763660 RepID=A0A926HUR4_9FIRM|nr:pyridoxal phosphate-dependent aminotransferase [Feifania hominis]MBC8535836.1 pyridoxal phosphate-dependent aminotransferase [Feifania hominis]
MRYDKNWENLYFPDFSPFAALDPQRGIMLMSADMFAPDGTFPKEVKDAIHRAVDEDQLHYPSNAVREEFRAEVAKKLREFNNIHLDDKTKLLIVPGSAFGLFLSIRTLINPNSGDEVINFTPTFAENMNDVTMMGAKNVFCPLHEENGYQIDVDELETYITPRTKCIIVTHPANPIGTVYPRETLEKLAALLKKHDIFAVVDQVFERCVYDGREYTTFASLPEMAQRTLTVFGPSKELRLSGLRIGYVTGPAELIDKMEVATDNYVGLPNPLSLVACTEAYRHLEYTEQWLAILENRRNVAREILNDIPNVSCPLPPAGFSFWLDVRKLGKSDEIVEYLVKEAQVGVGPGTWFGINCEGFLRVMFACYRDDETVYEACRRIAVALKKYQGIA